MINVREESKNLEQRMKELMMKALEFNMCPQLIINELNSERNARFYRYIEKDFDANNPSLADAFVRIDNESYNAIIQKYFPKR